MANRDNHYEAAFEAYLRRHRIAYVAVDETRRSLLADQSIKSLDFIVSPVEGPAWLVDVKGRRFPGGEQKQYWKNWSTRDDLVSLARWEQLFGERFQGVFVFAYDVVGDRSPLAVEQLFEFRDRRYGFVAVRLARYVFHARQVSPKWDTVAMTASQFRQLAEPMDTLLGIGEAVTSG